jgi:hypothetical protein
MMFSISDVQSMDEDDYHEGEGTESAAEGEDGAEEEHPINSYPIRVSFSITKVCMCMVPSSMTISMAD